MTGLHTSVVISGHRLVGVDPTGMLAMIAVCATGVHAVTVITGIYLLNLVDPTPDLAGLMSTGILLTVNASDVSVQTVSLDIDMILGIIGVNTFHILRHVDLARTSIQDEMSANLM